MKVSKRSLIMSIAVLCVCALSLTAASFAWFSTSTSANVNNIKLSVEKTSDLQITLTPDNEASWTYNIDYSKTAADTSISDVSTLNGISFFAPTENARKSVDEYGKIADDVAEYTTASAPMTIEVYFRSREQIGVKMFASKFATTADELIAPAMRVAAVVGETGTVFADTTTGKNKVISAVSEGVATFSDAVLSATDTTTANAILTLGSAADAGVTGKDGYYYGKAIIKYWVEGTDNAAINANTGYEFIQTLQFTIAE